MQRAIKRKKSKTPSRKLSKARDYPAVIAWSDEDQLYVARVPLLKGCVSHGATMEEASRQIHDAAEGWLKTARSSGIEVPSPPRGMSGTLSLRLPVSLHEEAARLSAIDGVSINQWIVSAVARAAGIKSV